jgi:hypothetical protein
MDKKAISQNTRKCLYAKGALHAADVRSKRGPGVEWSSRWGGFLASGIPGTEFGVTW